MRRPRLRLTVRRAMSLVLGVGLAIKLLLVAWDASSDMVYHVRQYPDTGEYTLRGHPLLEPDELTRMGYGSRLGRSLLGLPLVDNPCRCKAYFEMTESRPTVDVRTIHDRSLADWLRHDPRTIPDLAQALGQRPTRNGAAAKPAGPASPSPRPF